MGVTEVTELDEKIFILYYFEKTIAIFSNEHPFKQLGSIDIKMVSFPVDLVSCSDTMKLFVGGYSGAIWRVDIKNSSNDINKFVDHERSVMSMSLTHRRLLVTPRYNEKDNKDGYSLTVYDVVSGELLQSVQLPRNMEPRHAIELNNTFIVCHFGESRDHCGVSEVNSLGHVTRSYVGLLHIPWEPPSSSPTATAP